jgi:putative copper export protein/mono/diheme cytochrome c family protein
MISLATTMALVRGLHLAATLSLLGTAGFLAWMLPPAGADLGRLRLLLVRLWWISGSVALLAGLAWFTLQSATIAGAEDASDVWAALPLVAEHTRYGVMLMVRLVLVLAATLAGTWIARRRDDLAAPQSPDIKQAVTDAWRPFAIYVGLVLTATALALQGAIGHAGATAGVIGDGLLLSEALHLLAAGLWLGAMLPLWISLRVLPAPRVASVCVRFSPIGLACVLVLAGTGFAQGLALIGNLPALFGTPYGHIALLKIALFLLALVLAAANRLWLTDRLAGSVLRARHHLLVSVSVETALGLAIVTAAAFLASNVPGVHGTPVWPFPWQFSLVTAREDPDFAREVLISLAVIGAAILLLAVAVVRRHSRLIAMIVLLAVTVWRGSSFGLLFVEAYPTSFQTSPTGFAAASIAHGQALFPQNCAACHGADGEGYGPAAASRRIKPANLTQPHLWEHSDGEMFWFLTHGFDDPEGGLAMPGFALSLSADDRWALIDYVRAHNAAVAVRPDAALEIPVRAPALTIVCNGLTASTMNDLLGHAVLVVLGDAPHGIPQQEAITLSVSAGDAKPAAGSCAAADPAAWNAYAVLADLPPAEAAGSQFLVDPNGWLRAAQRPDTAGGWHSRQDLLAAIRGVITRPIEQPRGASHEHHH